MTGRKIEHTCPACGATFSAYECQKRVYCSRPCKFRADRGKSSPQNGVHLNPDYFYSFVTKSDGCWEWQGHRNARGYGHISVSSKLTLTHRHAWVLANGPIPDGLFVLHTCDNPPCVRPDHLYLGTKADNAQDRARRGRGNSPTGENHPCAKLKEAQVFEIRARLAAGESPIAIAPEYGVTRNLIDAIGRRRIWRHLPEKAA